MGLLHEAFPVSEPITYCARCGRTMFVFEAVRVGGLWYCRDQVRQTLQGAVSCEAPQS